MNEQQARTLAAWILTSAAASAGLSDLATGRPAATRAPRAAAAPVVSLQQDSHMGDILPRRARAGSFVLYSDAEIPLDELARLADGARRRMAEWLEIPPRDTGPYRFVPVYLCRDVETIYTVERRRGRPSSDHPGRSFPFRGGFYQDEGFIALEAKHLATVRWNLVHEVGHLVLAQRAPEVPDLVNEGLAELLTQWILESNAATPEDDLAVSPSYLERCRRAVVRSEIPPLRRLLRLDYWEFRDSEKDHLYYALGWHFARFLVTGEHPAVAGRFHALVGELERGRSGWMAFQIVYDADLVERLWREALERPLDWEEATGTWQATADGFRAAVQGKGSAMLIRRPSDGGEGARELSYEVPADVQHPIAFGFVLNYRDMENFDLLSVREGGREVVLAHWREGAWVDWELIELDGEQRVDSGRLRLRVGLSGEVALFQDEDPVLERRLVPGSPGDGIGLMFELRAEKPEEADSGERFSFRGVRSVG